MEKPPEKIEEDERGFAGREALFQKRGFLRKKRTLGITYCKDQAPRTQIRESGLFHICILDRPGPSGEIIHIPGVKFFHGNFADSEKGVIFAVSNKNNRIMSTRSNIGVLLKKEDKNITLTAPKNRNHTLDTAGADGMMVYVHNDGYVHGGVGEFLYTNFNEKDPETYCRLLGYLMEGDRSTADEGHAYNEFRGEESEPWTNVKPSVFKLREWTLPNLMKVANEEYLYVYDPEKMMWYVLDVYEGELSPLGLALDTPED